MLKWIFPSGFFSFKMFIFFWLEDNSFLAHPSFKVHFFFISWNILEISFLLIFCCCLTFWEMKVFICFILFQIVWNVSNAKHRHHHQRLNLTEFTSKIYPCVQVLFKVDMWSYLKFLFRLLEIVFHKFCSSLSFELNDNFQ